jgi:hypothetical protein
MICLLDPVQTSAEIDKGVCVRLEFAQRVTQYTMMGEDTPMPVVNSQGIWEGTEAADHHYFDGPLARALSNFFAGQSVIDLGCGTGEYVRTFQKAELGITAHGLDGNPTTPILSEGACRVGDLSKRLQQKQNPPTGQGQTTKATEVMCHEEWFAHDWSMSLEVAEHLPREYEDSFLCNLCRLGRKGVVMSWAVEGQEGIGHINCRNNDYVEGRMASLGYQLDYDKTVKLRTVASLPWFKFTVMVFVPDQERLRMMKELWQGR